MKRTAIKITSLFMALVLLVSTKSFALQKQFCGDTLVKVGLFSSPESIKLDINNDEDDCCYAIKNDCCSFENLITEGQYDLFVHTIEVPQVDQPSFDALETSYPIDYFNPKRVQYVGFAEYQPPNLVFDNNLINQVFRI